MNWTAILGIAVALAILFVLKRTGQISGKSASEYLKNGALVVDVRSPQEFGRDHLRGAINVPLGEIETALPRRIKDKKQVLLLHCQSGVRSGIAARKLKALGYTNAFNLGSYGRAANIVNGG